MTFQLKKNRYCKYPFCETHKTWSRESCGHINKKFYRFPKDASQLAIWKEVCGIHPNVKCTNFHICEDHFLLSDFKIQNFPKRLNNKAVPKINVKTLPEEIKEHDYAIVLNSIPQCDEGTAGKNGTKLQMELKSASLEHNINFLKYVNANKNFVCAETKSDTIRDSQDDYINSVDLFGTAFRGNNQIVMDDKKTCKIPSCGNDNSFIGETNTLIPLSPAKLLLLPPEYKINVSDSTVVLAKEHNDSTSSFSYNIPEKNKAPLPFNIDSVYSLNNTDKIITSAKIQNVGEYFSNPENTLQLHINAIPRSLTKSEQVEHNYAHQMPWLQNDHNYALNLHQ